MKVRMKIDVSGTRDGVEWPGRGGELEVSDVEGAHLCALDYAEPVAEAPKPEKAVAPAAEKRGGRGRSKPA